MVLDRKPRSYWGLVLTFGLAILPRPLSEGFAQDVPAEEQVNPETAQEEPAEEPAIEPEPSPPVVLPAEPTGTEHDGGPPGEAPEDASQDDYLFFGDGLAQWVMAVTGGLALVLSGWAVWLLKRTLDATRKAIEIAEDGNQAAKAAVDVTREIGEAQVRAYLTMEEPEVEIKVRGGQVFWKLLVTVRNSGQSPARKISLQASFDNFDSFGGGMVPDLGSGASHRASAIRSTAWDELRFIDESKTKVDFRCAIRVKLQDVFMKGDERTIEPAQVRGIVQPIHGRRIPLAIVRDVDAADMG